MPYATIAGLNIYPVKSCRGITLDRASIGRTGLEDDRHWMIMTDAGRFMTQRELPRMALIEPGLENGTLVLNAPAMPALRVDRDAGGKSVQVAVWGDTCDALDVGDEPARWLSAFLERPVRLLRYDPAGVRPTDPDFTGGVESFNEFSDGFPLLVISKASLVDLNTRLDVQLPMNRFRPNIVLDGVGAYEEDRINELFDDATRLRIAKPCTRCKITTTDQATGEVMGMEPLQTLKSYRWSKEFRGVMFGQNTIVLSGTGGELRVGQRLEFDLK